MELLGLEAPVFEICGVRTKQIPVRTGDEDALWFDHIDPVDVNGVQGIVIGSSSDGLTEHRLVETFDGAIFSLPEENLQEVPHLPPSAGGHFDLVWPVNDREGVDLIACDALELIAARGWCLIQSTASQGMRKAAVAQALDLVDWHLPAPELEACVAGHDNATKVAELDFDDDSDALQEALPACDAVMTRLGMMLAPYTPAQLGFSLWGRHGGQARMPCKPAEKRRLRQRSLREEDYSLGGKVQQHLSLMERQQLQVLFFVDNEGGQILIHSRLEDSTAEIKLRSGQLLVFLPEVVSYSYLPVGDRSLLLQTWFVTEPTVIDIGGPEAVELPASQQRERVHIDAMHYRFGGGVENAEESWNMWIAGTDCAQTLPLNRFDLEGYYSDDGGGLMYTKHFAGISEALVMGFDHHLFNLSEYEAQALGPGQRNQLEVGYEILARAGYNRASLKGLRCGVYMGDGGTDWKVCGALPKLINGVSDGIEPNIHAYSGWQIGMGANRLSHLLDMRGPCVSVDTACSSSLVALGQASRTLAAAHADDRYPSVGSHIDKALVMGLCLDDGVATFVAYCMATMLSHDGRSFTFDQNANGFLRGEGVGGLFATLNDSDESAQRMLACLVGSAVNQDGRSASMTAPHGPSQQSCIRASMDEAGLKASEITVAECHGTGTALGDPIEVGALRAVMKDRGVDPVVLTTSKANFGHMEACAGMGGIGKCVLMLNSMVGSCNIHLHKLNDHIEEAGFPALFVDEHVPLNVRSGVAGVSSFGVGGTNARSDMWARCTQGHLATKEIYTRDRQSLQLASFTKALNDEGALVGPASSWAHRDLLCCHRPLPDSRSLCGDNGQLCASCERLVTAKSQALQGDVE